MRIPQSGPSAPRCGESTAPGAVKSPPRPEPGAGRGIDRAWSGEIPTAAGAGGRPGNRPRLER
jgi:hypothetical protein